ncbi:MAG: serine kinase, partial [Fusobacteriaceae bacterium]
MSNQEKKNNFLTLRDMCKELELECLTACTTENIEIKEKNVYRVSSELLGIEEICEDMSGYIHVMGGKESNYLSGLPKEESKKIIEKYFNYKFSTLILGNDFIIDKYFLEIAEKFDKPILKAKISSLEIIKDLKFFLQKHMAEELLLEDYAFMEIEGVGVLLSGDKEAQYGIIVELIERGHKFITDKFVLIRKEAVDELVGYNRFKIYHKSNDYFLEGENDSKVDISTLFGLKSTRNSKRINILVNLESWDNDKFYDRLGLDTICKNFLGVEIPEFDLPVKKGRNIAVIIEVAARNYRLKQLGVDSAKVFAEEAKKLISKNKDKKEKSGEMGRKALSVKEFIEKNNLEILCNHEFIDDRFISGTNIFRPLLALNGHFDEDEFDGVQVFSQQEFKFLDSLPLEKREENLNNYFKKNYPLIVVTKNVEIPFDFMYKVKDTKIILARAEFDDTTENITRYNTFIIKYYSPSITMHGVFMEL